MRKDGDMQRGEFGAFGYLRYSALYLVRKVSVLNLKGRAGGRFVASVHISPHRPLQPPPSPMAPLGGVLPPRASPQYISHPTHPFTGSAGAVSHPLRPPQASPPTHQGGQASAILSCLPPARLSGRPPAQVRGRPPARRGSGG